MILRLSESQNGVAVEIKAEICPASFPPHVLAPSPGSQIVELQSELLDQAMDQAHNQLMPLLRQARLSIEANLEREVLYSLRDSMPNVQSSGTRGG
jgi:hypothetical protein